MDGDGQVQERDQETTSEVATKTIENQDGETSSSAGNHQPTPTPTSGTGTETNAKQEEENAESNTLTETNQAEASNAFQVLKEISRSICSRVSFAEESNLVKTFSNDDDDEEVNKEKLSIRSTRTRSGLGSLASKSNYWTRSNRQPGIRSGKVSKSGIFTGNTQLFEATIYNYLWTQPTVHQELTVFPIATGHVPSKALAEARKKSKRLDEELHKAPTKHRLSDEDPKIANLKANPIQRQSVAAPPSPSPNAQPAKRSTASNPGPGFRPMILNTQKNKNLHITKNRTSVGSHRNEAAVASAQGTLPTGLRMSVAEHRLQRKASQITNVSIVGSMLSTKSISDPEQTHSILIHLREENEEMEKNSCRGKMKRFKQKVCGPCNKCFAHQKVTDTVFLVVLGLICLCCVIAICFPIIRMFV